MLVVIRDFSRRPKRVLHVAAIFDLTVLAVHDQRNLVLHRDMHREVGLTVDEGLKRITDLLESQSGQLSGRAAIWRPENVVEARSDERVEIPAANFSRAQWRPGNGQRVHSIFVLELVGDEAAILSSAARDDDVEFAVAPAESIAQVDQLPLALRPINLFALESCKVARRAHAVVIERDARPLVRYGAKLAEPYGSRQVILGDDVLLLHFGLP